MSHTDTNVNNLKINRGTYADIQANLSSIGENELIITTDKNIPVPTSADSGKVVSIDSSGDYVLANVTATIDSIPTNQANIAFILSNNTNINGKTMSAYSWNYYEVTLQSTTYETYQIKKNNAILTKAEAGDYLAGLCGSHFVAEYNYDTPTNSYIIRASDYQILKPQWDSTNGLLLWFMNQLDIRVKQTLTTGVTDALPVLMSGTNTSNSNNNFIGGVYRNNNIYVSSSTGAMNAPLFTENGTSLTNKYLRYYAQNDATSGVTVANINAPNATAGDKVIMGLSNNDGAMWGKVGADQMSGSLPYLTTAPSAANTDGLKIVVLNAEPSTRYSGYLYIITGGN